LSNESITFVFPCLNEEVSIAAVVIEAQQVLATLGYAAEQTECLVVDNGSTDQSIDLARKCGARVVVEPNRGYGNALRRGIHEAHGPYLAMADADGSYDLSALPGMIRMLDRGFHLVVGNRFHGNIEPGAMPWKNRYIGNPGLSLLGRILFGGPNLDWHCGLRAFQKPAIERLPLKSEGMEFASEMIALARLEHLRIGQVPVNLRRDLREGRPHLRPWRDGFRHLRTLFRIRCGWT